MGRVWDIVYKISFRAVPFVILMVIKANVSGETPEVWFPNAHHLWGYLTWTGENTSIQHMQSGLVFNDTSCSRCSKENFCSSFVGAACNCCNVSLRFERQAAFSQSSCAYHSFSPQLRTVSLQWTLTHKWGQADRAGVREKNIPPFKHAGAAPLASHITSLDRAVSLLVTITSDNCTAEKYNAERVSQTCSLRTEIAQPHCRKI